MKRSQANQPQLAAAVDSSALPSESPAAEPPPRPKPRGRRSVPPATAEPPPLYAEAPHAAFPPPPNLRAGFERVVRQIYDDGVDVAAEYDLIVRALSIEGALTPGAIRAASAHAEEMARRAYRLYLLARFEQEQFVRQSDVLVGAIQTAALQHLEQAKAAGLRTKMITDGDVQLEAATRYSDEWADVQGRRARAKGMRDMVERLADLADKRCYTVSRLLEPGTGRV